jgi:hypothetical protein
VAVTATTKSSATNYGSSRMTRHAMANASLHSSWDIIPDQIISRSYDTVPQCHTAMLGCAAAAAPLHWGEKPHVNKIVACEQQFPELHCTLPRRGVRSNTHWNTPSSVSDADDEASPLVSRHINPIIETLSNLLPFMVVGPLNYDMSIERAKRDPAFADSDCWKHMPLFDARELNSHWRYSRGAQTSRDSRHERRERYRRSRRSTKKRLGSSARLMFGLGALSLFGQVDEAKAEEQDDCSTGSTVSGSGVDCSISERLDRMNMRFSCANPVSKRKLFDHVSTVLAMPASTVTGTLANSQNSAADDKQPCLPNATSSQGTSPRVTPASIRFTRNSMKSSSAPSTPYYGVCDSPPYDDDMPIISLTSAPASSVATTTAAGAATIAAATNRPTTPTTVNIDSSTGIRFPSSRSMEDMYVSPQSMVRPSQRRTNSADGRSHSKNHRRSSRHRRRRRSAGRRPRPMRRALQRLVVGDCLVLRKGDITSQQWRALSEFLQSCPEIRSIRLHGIDITAEDATSLGPGLSHIRSITFCDNSIGLRDDALEVLVALLLCCGMLECASIMRNSLTDRHVPEIVKLIKEHHALSRLSLCWNGIGIDGASSIVEAALHPSSNLRDCDLGYNNISASGFDTMRESLANHAVSRRLPLCVHVAEDRELNIQPKNMKLRHGARMPDIGVGGNTDPDLSSDYVGLGLDHSNDFQQFLAHQSMNNVT